MQEVLLIDQFSFICCLPRRLKGSFFLFPFSFPAILGARIVLWEGSLRSYLDRPWRREAPLFLLEVSGPFPFCRSRRPLLLPA